MSALKGDYIGFTYNGKHSSDLGIVRTSNGSRFDENLLPTMQDKTAQVPGGDGTYYFGSYYTQRQFPVSFAFDSLTEEQFAELKKLFGDKKIHDLIFDERPYKTWKAKVTGSATIKHIPFAEGETNRIYKGEGTIQFTCYQPYAVCEKKWLSDYVTISTAKQWKQGLYEYNSEKKMFVEIKKNEFVSSKTYYEDIKNINEWSVASGLKDTQNIYDKLQGANSIKLYNPGDLESHFLLRFDFQNGKIGAGQLSISQDSGRLLNWKEITAEKNDAYVKFNTKLNLIEGYRADNIKSGYIYNQYISDGAFFTIPQGESTLVIADAASYVKSSSPIEYNYYYF